MNRMDANDDLTYFNGVLLSKEMAHEMSLIDGIWKGKYEGIVYKNDSFKQIFDSKPKTLIVKNKFFEGEFDYKLYLYSNMDDFLIFTLELTEHEIKDEKIQLTIDGLKLINVLTNSNQKL